MRTDKSSSRKRRIEGEKMDQSIKQKICNPCNKERLAERSIEDIRTLVYEKSQAPEPFCCFVPEHRQESMIGCGRPAVVNIYCESDPPDVVTQSCLLHVGELLSDGYCQVWPIEFDNEVEPEDVKTIHPLKPGMWVENGCGEKRKILQVRHDEKIYKVELETGHELWAWTACRQVPNQVGAAQMTGDKNSERNDLREAEGE